MPPVRLSLLGCLLSLAIPLSATTVTGQVSTLIRGPVDSSMTAQLTLYHCPSDPVLTATGTKVSRQSVVLLNSSGNLSISVPGNDTLSCAGQAGKSYYELAVMKGSLTLATKPLFVQGTTMDAMSTTALDTSTLSAYATTADTTSSATVPAAGMVTSDGTSLKTAVAGTDYQAPLAANAYVQSVNGKTGAVITDYDSRLQAFLDKAVTAQFQHVDVLILGDSLSRCWQGTTGTNGNCPGTGPINKDALWGEGFKRYVQKRWGSGGTGLIPLQSRIDSGGFLDTATYTLTGTYTPNSFLGPSTAGNGSSGSIYQFSPGATIAMAAQSGTSVRLYGATGGDNLGWTITIDGATVGTSYMTASGGNGTATYFEVAAPTGFGAHTVVFTAAGGTGHSYAYGAEWRNPTGISVHNVSEGTCTAACFAATIGLQLAFSDMLNPVLTFIELGVNDAFAAVGTSAFQANEQALITHQKNIGSQVILLNSPFVQATDVSPYLAVNAALATANNIPLYDAANTLFISYSNEVANGWMNADAIHLGNTGQLKWGSWLIPLLFGVSQGIPAYQDPLVLAGASFNGGTVTTPLTITSNSSTPPLNLQNMLASDFTLIRYTSSDAATRFSVGIGNPGTGDAFSNSYFIYNNMNGGQTVIRVLGSNSSILFPLLHSTTGTRYLCIGTDGTVTSSATACSGT